MDDSHRMHEIPFAFHAGRPSGRRRASLVPVPATRSLGGQPAQGHWTASEGGSAPVVGNAGAHDRSLKARMAVVCCTSVGSFVMEGKEVMASRQVSSSFLACSA